MGLKKKKSSRNEDLLLEKECNGKSNEIDKKRLAAIWKNEVEKYASTYGQVFCIGEKD